MGAERAEFSYDQPFQAAGGLVFAGRSYKHGEPFDWRRLGVSEIDVWNLWALGRIDNVTDAELERLTAPRTPAKPQPTARR